MELIILIVIIAGFALVLYMVGGRSKSDTSLVEVIKVLQTGSQADRAVLTTRLDQATQTLSDLQRSIGEMSELGRSMKEMQEFLLSPKLRGNIGEQVLNELLSQMLPKSSFHLQYRFQSGEKVDAAIKTGAGIIPVDSKFPMENFRRMLKAQDQVEKKHTESIFMKDIKNHIDAISNKYINTTEGTIDYALMYVPSEAVYYEVVNNQRLYEYASEKRVLPVSPTTFYAYLRAILMSFEGQKIAEQGKEILMALSAVQKEYSKLEENVTTLQRHLTNASNMMSTVMNGFQSLGQKIIHTKAISSTKEVGRKLQ